MRTKPVQLRSPSPTIASLTQRQRAGLLIPESGFESQGRHYTEAMSNRNLNTAQFVPSDDNWAFRYPAQAIDSAINEYPAHIKTESQGESQAPYNAESLAEVYHPRVKRLMDLQSQGNTHAAWGRLGASGTNDWHGVPEGAPKLEPLKGMTPVQAKKHAAKFLN